MAKWTKSKLESRRETPAGGKPPRVGETSGVTKGGESAINGPLTPPTGLVKPEPGQYEEQLPVMHGLVIGRIPGKGWGVVEVWLQGDELVQAEAVSTAPESRAVAVERLKLETIRRVCADVAKGDA